MPVFRTNRNKIIMLNALMGDGKLACARKLEFTHCSSSAEEQKTDSGNYHVQADDAACTLEAEKECNESFSIKKDGNYHVQADDAACTLEAEEECSESFSIKKEHTKKVYGLSKHEEEKVHEQTHITNNSVTTNAMACEIPENKRVRVLDVKIIKAPDPFINHANSITSFDNDNMEENIQNYTEEKINIDTDPQGYADNIPIVVPIIQSDHEEIHNNNTNNCITVHAIVHDVSENKRVNALNVKRNMPSNTLINHENNTSDLDMIEEEIQHCTEEEINLDPEQNQNVAEDKENFIQNSMKRKTSERKTKVHANKSYFDFLSDDEVLEYVWDSSSWKGSDTSSSEDDQNQSTDKKITKKKKKNKAKRQKVTCEEDEIVNEKGLKKKKKIPEKESRRVARQSGKQYETASGRTVAEKNMKSNPCMHAKKCPYKCKDIPEEKRQNLFNHFNGLTLQRKRDWLAAMCLKEIPKRKRNIDTTRREYSYLYFINEGEGRRQVCLRFLLSTLDITQKFVHYTLANSDYGSGQQDMRGKAIPPNKTKSEIIAILKSFIMNLPAVPSHLCRKDSSRVYLPSDMKNIPTLYENYKKKQQEDGMDYVGEKVFRNIFSNEFNIGFHVPKKDKCVKCIKYADLAKVDAIDAKTMAEKEKHEVERESSNNRFKFHKDIRLKDKSTICVSFDMQKVLNTPMGNNMLLFYSRKYAVYNLTFYESVTRNGYCYTWGETEGKRGANEVATILIKYIEELDARNEAQNVLLYCDSCPGQNKNRTVLAALHYVLQKCINIARIQINYLLPGHTMMPVDSMHAVIENSLTSTIWAPSQWATVFQLARKSFGPYNVTVLDHEDFLRLDKLGEKYFKGNLCGKISKLTEVTMKKYDKKIKVKYSMHPESASEIVEVVGGSKQLSQAYKSSLPLPEKKYADLLALCKKNIIPKQYHSEYINMEAKNVPEVLMETDEEDEYDFGE